MYFFQQRVLNDNLNTPADSIVLFLAMCIGQGLMYL